MRGCTVFCLFANMASFTTGEKTSADYFFDFYQRNRHERMWMKSG